MSLNVEKNRNNMLNKKYLFKVVKIRSLLFFFQISLIFFGCLFFVFPGKALVVSPARIEVEIDPGEEARGEVSLVNDRKQAQTFYSSVQNFEAGGELGVPRFVDENDGLADWVKVAERKTLQLGERIDVPFEVKPPKDAGVGGHFAAIFWGTEPPQSEGGGNVSLGAKVGSLLFLRVKGKVIEKGEIVEFRSVNKNKLFNRLPIDFMFRFENSGNDRLKPTGKVEIYNMFGSKTETLLANKTQGSVLPESIRRFFISWGREDISQLQSDFAEDQVPGQKKPFFETVKEQLSNFHFGKYTAVLNLDFGTEAKQAQSRYTFYIIPWQLLAVFLCFFIVLIFIGKAGIKRYNRRIIKKHSKLQNEKDKKKE